VKKILLVLLILTNIGVYAVYAQKQKTFEVSRFRPPKPSLFDPMVFKIVTNDTIKLTIAIEPLMQDLPVVKYLTLDLKPGEYIIPWDGLDNAGKACREGVYFFSYKIETDRNFSKPITFLHSRKE